MLSESLLSILYQLNLGIHKSFILVREIILDEVRSVCEKICKSIKKKYQLGPEELSLFETESKKLIQTYEKNTDARIEKLNVIILFPWLLFSFIKERLYDDLGFNVMPGSLTSCLVSTVASTFRIL